MKKLILPNDLKTSLVKKKKLLFVLLLLIVLLGIGGSVYFIAFKENTSTRFNESFDKDAANKALQEATKKNYEGAAKTLEQAYNKTSSNEAKASYAETISRYYSSSKNISASKQWMEKAIQLYELQGKANKVKKLKTEKIQLEDPSSSLNQFVDSPKSQTTRNGNEN
jgi:uncharacterized protein (UPF0333 family)